MNPPIVLAVTNPRNQSRTRTTRTADKVVSFADGRRIQDLRTPANITDGGRRSRELSSRPVETVTGSGRERAAVRFPPIDGFRSGEPLEHPVTTGSGALRHVHRRVSVRDQNLCRHAMARVETDADADGQGDLGRIEPVRFGRRSQQFAGDKQGIFRALQL